MNPHTVTALLSRYSLGSKVLSLTEANQSRHTAWKLVTDAGTYAAKVLASKDADWASRYEATERIALKLSNIGVNAVAALRSDGGHVVSAIDGRIIAVYPWIDGDISQPNTDRSIEIARLLAAIHNADLSEPDLPPKHPPAVDFDLLDESSPEESFRSLATETNDVLARLNPLLEPTLLSHTDLHPENVIWRDGEPYIIDWEEACMAFYSFDVIGTAMMWSGLHGGGTFDVARYEAFLLTYVDAYRGPHVCSPDVGFWMAMGWGFAWLSHNLRRLRRPDLTPEDVDKHQTAADKVIRALLASSEHRQELLTYNST